MTLVAVPPPQPSRSNTVAVASVARMISTVSQPTVSSQEITAGSLLPRTPNAARLSTIVGAEPRLPATAMNPHSRNETTMPTTPDDHRLPERDAEAEHERAVAEAEHRDVGGEPRPEQVARAALALGLGDDVDAVGLDLQRSRFGCAAARAHGALTFSHGKHLLPPVSCVSLPHCLPPRADAGRTARLLPH